MRLKLTILALLCAAAPTTAAAAAAQDWRFCVGVSSATHESVITDVFVSSADSARIEHRLESFFRTKKGRSLTFQCPRGDADRTNAVNAQTSALKFNQLIGFSVTPMPAADLSAALLGEAQ